MKKPKTMRAKKSKGPRPLSKTQKELLLSLVPPGARIPMYNRFKGTVQVLSSLGYIEKQSTIADHSARLALATEIEIYAAAARDLLAHSLDNWHQAAEKLGYCIQRSARLDDTCWRITDAGRNAAL